ncbi:hypothetical protein KI387_002088, partial [Taxus chinensis]
MKTRLSERKNYCERWRNSGDEKQKKRGRKELKSSEDVCFICLDGGDLVLCEHGICLNEEDFVFIKKPRGFCGHCFKIVNMIEENKDVDSDG